MKRALTYAEADYVISSVKEGIPSFYVENVVIPTLMSIPAIRTGTRGMTQSKGDGNRGGDSPITKMITADLNDFVSSLGKRRSYKPL